MKLNEVMWLENESKERWVNEDELKQLHSKYKFVSMWDEAVEAFRVVMLADVPANITTSQVDRLVGMALGIEHGRDSSGVDQRLSRAAVLTVDELSKPTTIAEITTHFKLRGQRERGRAGRYTFNVVPVMKWIQSAIQFQGSNDFEEDQ